MKNFSDKQMYILQRFIQLNQLPTNSQNVSTLKKIIILKNIYTQQKCIMKVQPKQLLQSKERNVLHQASFYQKFQGHIGIPLMIWSGQDFDCLVLILQELGISLYDRMKFHCSTNRMRIKDACMIGIQLIDIIKNFHERDYLHKNITPQTFSFGRNEKITKLYVNDLLFMKKYRAKNNLNHIQQKQRVRLEYLTPFQSQNVLSGKQASRRDDVISIIYVLIYLIKGKLPWQQDWQEDISSKKQQISDINQKQQINLVFQMKQTQKQQISFKVQRMRKIQQSLTSQQLCKGLPRQIKQILDMVYELQFMQDPEYYRYIGMLKKILFRQKLKNDSLFEWMESISHMQSHLKADSNFIKLDTYKKKQLQLIVYQPYEQKIDLDSTYQEKLKKSVNQGIYSIARESLNQNQISGKKGNVSIKKRNNCQLI